MKRPKVTLDTLRANRALLLEQSETLWRMWHGTKDDAREARYHAAMRLARDQAEAIRREIDRRVTRTRVSESKKIGGAAH